MPINQVSDLIENSEYRLAKLKAIKEKFPNAKINSRDEINCKSVNTKYTNLEFHSDSWGLYVSPYCEFDFIYKEKIEKIKVLSAPKRSKLIYITWNKGPDGRRIIRFSRLAFNLKHNNFREDLLQTCQVKMAEFLSTHQNFSIDTTHLHPRLKKIMGFM